MLSPKMPNPKKYLKDFHHPIKPAKNAHKGLSVPAIVFAHGSIKHKAKSLPSMGHLMAGCLVQVKKSNKAIITQPHAPKQTITNQDLQTLVNYAHALGVDQVGFTPVDPQFIFTEGTVLYENAMVLTMEMKRDKIDTAPSPQAGHEIFRTYYELGVIVNKLADKLKSMGYRAQAGPAIGGEANYVMLAQAAGLGYCGKHGLLISPDLGPSLRIAVVYTDIQNLPQANVKQHAWVKNFCKSCQACVKGCPAQAIYASPHVFDDGSEEHIDYKQCASPFSRQDGCTLCVKNCTFYKVGYHKLKEKFHEDPPHGLPDTQA